MFSRLVRYAGRVGGTCSLALGVLLAGISLDAAAIPLFARQTGQNCMACHAGGQFPELTSYGRMFKLTGYTMGTRTAVPVSVMGVASATRIDSTKGSTDVAGEYPQNGLIHPTTASVFAGGKITDNIGLFGQWTFNAYDHQNSDSRWVGHSTSDQFDLRYADRFIDANQDLIIGASLNNNPGVTDVWNTFNSAFTGMPSYVPAANPTGIPGPAATPIMLNLGQLASGKNIYAYWNNLLYAELGFYQTANGVFSILSQGIPDGAMVKLKGQNPYFRLALNRDWGANSAMIGLHGMNANVYFGSPDTASPTIHYRDLGIDGQYQYLLDPHTVSAQFSYTHEKQSYPDTVWNGANPNFYPSPGGVLASNPAKPSNTVDYLRIKGTYVYQAKYGASLGYVSSRGSADANLYPTVSDGTLANASNRPNTTYWVPEVFVMPLQYIRVGLQYYAFSKYDGVSKNYNLGSDGVTWRDARDNNTLFLYVWAAY